MIVLMLTMFGSAVPALLAFPSERPVFLREYSTNHYSVFSYFVSKLTMEALLTLAQSTLLVRHLFDSKLYCIALSIISHVPFTDCNHIQHVGPPAKLLHIHRNRLLSSHDKHSSCSHVRLFG